MAISGNVLFGFVLGHMTGNLKVFQGPEKFNAYSEWLREIGHPLLPHGGALWLARAVLLLAVGLHIWSAAELTRMSRRARPERYARRGGLQLDYAARTMRWSGVLIGFYVVYHLMHLTSGNVHPDFVAGDVYHNLVSGFAWWPIATLYIVSNVFLGFDLYHGLWSMFQSLGWNDSGYGGWPATSKLWERRVTNRFLFPLAYRSSSGSRQPHFSYDGCGPDVSYPRGGRDSIWISHSRSVSCKLSFPYFGFTIPFSRLSLPCLCGESY